MIFSLLIYAYYYYYYFFLFFFIFYFSLGTAFPRGYKNWYKHWTLERLAFKIRWGYKSAPKADTVKTLHCDRQPLKEKRSLTVIARHSRDPPAQVRQKRESFYAERPHGLE